MSPTSLTIDHVTIAAPELATLERAFTSIGLRPEYGGPHSNGATHMDVLGFDDGSYIELIAKLNPGAASSLWEAQITGNGGPCAWAVATDDIASEAARIAALGVPVTVPVPLNRTRPDGTLVEWQLAFLGNTPPGAVLPFLIQDRTPRALRVQPSASVTGSELTGVGMVVLGVRDLDAAADLFRRVFGWHAPAQTDDPAFGARLAHVAGTRVTLAAPLSADGWLAQRLARYGDSPCAFLLASRDLAASARRLPLAAPGSWFGRAVRWLDPTRIEGSRLGVLASA